MYVLEQIEEKKLSGREDAQRLGWSHGKCHILPITIVYFNKSMSVGVLFLPHNLYTARGDRAIYYTPVQIYHPIITAFRLLLVQPCPTSATALPYSSVSIVTVVCVAEKRDTPGFSTGPLSMNSLARLSSSLSMCRLSTSWSSSWPSFE